MNTLNDILYTARVYLRITCVIWTCACIGWYAYYCYTGRGISLAVPVTLVADRIEVVKPPSFSVRTDMLDVKISQADPKVITKIEKANK